MSDVLQRIANIHRERVAKNEKKRLTRKRKLASQQAYFRESGILEMWNDVKDIVVKNPIPDILEGIAVPLSALVEPAHDANIEQTGLVLRDTGGRAAMWLVEDHSNEADEQPKLYYNVVAGKNHFRYPHDQKDIKKQFCDSFVKWLSRHITAQMMAEMNIDIETPSVTKRSRKILQLAET